MPTISIHEGPMQRSATILLLCAGVACASPTAPDANGRWGSGEANVELSTAGGTLTLQCGTGLIDPAWSLSKEGDFSATGTTFAGGGPDPVGGRPPRPSRFTGRITGDTFVLSVVVIATNTTLGPFRMQRGGPAVTLFCL